MDEYEDRDVTINTGGRSNIMLEDDYYTKSTVFKGPFIDTTSQEKIYIDHKNITEYINPRKPIIPPININLPTSVTIDKVNNILKGIVLVLANSSLFVPISYIGGNTKKNKSKKKINNNNN
jgi:hypothetical protein